MAVSPAYAENLAEPIMRLYADAELVMLELIARHLAQGTEAPDWAERKLLELQLINARLRGQLTSLRGRAAEEIAAALVKAYNRGHAGAIADLARLAEGALHTAEAHVAGLPDVTALLSETTNAVLATHQRILRAVPDIYRQVVREAAGQVLVGTQTRRQAAQSVLDRLTAKGITGFVDRAGRGWDLASYVEMAVRTGTGRAAIQGHTDRLQAAGKNLVIVSDAPQECKACRPWEGKILSLGPIPTGEAVATLDFAMGQGLLHPSCRHSVSAYQAGFTRPLTNTADPQGDADRQKLRYLERQTRQWKRRQAVALDEQARRTAGAKVHGYQARIREHTATTTAKRQPAREQIGSAR